LWEVFVGVGPAVGGGVAVRRGRVVEGDAVGVCVLGVALGDGLRVAGLPVSVGSPSVEVAGSGACGAVLVAPGMPGPAGGVSEPPPESAAMENIVSAPATATAPTP
jgi:hypothetical protein